MTPFDDLSTWPEDRRAELRAYLETTYKGVFTEDAIRFHLDAHVGYAFAEYAATRIMPSCREGERLLDIGSGFGSFVLAARARGLDARGVEIAEYETALAKWRLARVRPRDDPDVVFRVRDARALDDPPRSVDIVTLWNVLEHVDELPALLASVERMLRPGGRVFVICPNYLAWRLEAHYLIPWNPWLAVVPRPWAAKRIRNAGRDPRFFENHIFRRTNREVQSAFRRLGFRLFNFDNDRPMDLGHGGLKTLRERPRLFLDFWNPFRPAVELAARKDWETV